MFQNIIYKPRHVIPLIPFILMIASHGIVIIEIKFRKLKKIIIIFILCIFLVTSYLNLQHQHPSAISQLKSHVINAQYPLKVFHSSPLMNRYLKEHKGYNNIKFINLNLTDQINEYYESGYTIFSTKKLDIKTKDKSKKTFYHNPYVNRLWSKITIYEYKKN